MGYQDKEKELKMCYSVLEKFEEDLQDCKRDLNFLKENEENSSEYQEALEAATNRENELKITIKLLKGRINKLEN